MRIATLSDLHLDHPANREALSGLAVAVAAGDPALIVVAGDISHQDAWIRAGLRALKALGPEIAFVPGNHDLWEPKAAQPDSWRRYREQLPALCAEEGVHYLPSAPLVLGRVGIAGTCGWYDHSLLLPELRGRFSDDELAKKRYGRGVWNDVNHVRFVDADGATMTDPAVARVMEAELAAQLAALDADPAVDAVVAVTHHLPYSEVAFRTYGLPWEFFNAFMGSEGLGRVLDGSDKIHSVVYGHSHVHIEAELRGRRVYNRPLGYPRERRGIAPEAYASRYVGWIEVDA